MKKENQKRELPDFDRLSDRVIQETPSGPFIGAKTNLDPENTEEFNPYRNGGRITERE